MSAKEKAEDFAKKAQVWLKEAVKKGQEDLDKIEFLQVRERTVWGHGVHCGGPLTQGCWVSSRESGVTETGADDARPQVGSGGRHPPLRLAPLPVQRGRAIRRVST